MSDPIHIHISAAQVSKARRGLPIQIAHSSIGNPQGHLFKNLHPETHKKLLKAKRAKKGTRIQLTQEELIGAGFMDVMKKVGKFIVKNKSVLKPLATAILDTGAHFIPAAAGPREMVRKFTGVGVKPVVAKRRPAKRTSCKRATKRLSGSGLVPAGYGGY